MIKLSDYVMELLASRGIDTFFTVSGGGIMHLLDSLGSNQRLRYYCNYHEQASAIAAEGWARVANRPAGCLVTLGPGAVNALAGVVGAWFDSVPMVVLTGQVRRDLIADYSKIRQMGPQEGPTVNLVAPVTKYAKTILDPLTIRYEVEKALWLAVNGRPGPVWIDIPLDVQGAQIDETQLRGFDPAEMGEPWDRAALQAKVAEVLSWLVASRRPVLVGGTGIRMGGAHELFLQVAETLGLPVVLPYTAKDLIPEAHPLNFGIFGTAGQRRANFAVQNCDLVLSCASGFSLSKVGFNFKGFAPKGRKVMVDVDPGQLHHQVIKPDLPVLADVRAFLEELLRQAQGRRFEFSPRWLPACQRWRERYPIIVPEFLQDTGHVNSYVFMDKLADHMKERDVVVAGNGLDTVTYYQSFKVKPGQRTMTSNNWGSMGWDLPLSIGACIANERRPTVCVTGDGSIQWNIQELLFLQHHRLPVKVFVFNNRGYSSIRATQNAFFNGRYVGADLASGVANPDFAKLADAYGIAYFRIDGHGDLDQIIPRVLATAGPALCEVKIAIEQGISPKASAFRRADGTLESRPLEDMAPFLPREEIHENMHQFDDETPGP
ncbi:MAG: thiamine pyrophosphate-binding protein [Opitutae bacterium]|nr:thiamine pyrophosphate-binding protein [Opitutae bacterium]